METGSENASCWMWPGVKQTTTGYALARLGGKHILAHRLIWEMLHGSIPKGKEVLRKCGNKDCINPAHLELKRHGVATRRVNTLEIRFWKKVRTGPILSCWEWLGAKGSTGYGHIFKDGKVCLAHRISWELHHGEPPTAGVHVLHTCDNPACVNPKHLFLGTDKDNQLDKLRKGRGVNPVGEHNGKSKLKTEQVKQIKKDLPFMSRVEIAREHGVHPNTISAIAKGITWRHI